MVTARRGWPCLLLALACVGGCGGADPLVGTWKSTMAATTLLYDIHADGTFTYEIDGQDPSSRCVDTSAGNGTWTTSGSTLTMQVVSGTFAVTGCTNASLDMATHPDPDLDTSAHVATYAVDADVLTITPMGSSSPVRLMRQ